MAQNEKKKNANSTEPSTITVDQMKRELNCGRLKIYALMESGVIPAVRIHPKGRWIVSRCAFRNWLQVAGTTDAARRAAVIQQSRVA